MKIAVINGTPVKGVTYHMKELFLSHMGSGNEIIEFCCHYHQQCGRAQPLCPKGCPNQYGLDGRIKNIHLRRSDDGRYLFG